MIVSRRVRALSGLAFIAAFAASFSLVDEKEAQASGFLTSRFGADHGHPALSTPYAVYFNPAALGGMRGTHIVADGVLALRHIDYTRPSSALSPSDPATVNDPNYIKYNTGKNAADNILASPYIGVVTDFGTKGVRFGFASYVPFGGAIKWSKVSGFENEPYSKGAVDGSQRWSSISGRALNLYNTVAFAYRIEPIRLSIGASASFIYSNINSIRARNADGSDDVLGPNGALSEGRALLETSGIGMTMGAGLHWEPMEDGKLRLGLSYMAPANFGQDMRLAGTLEQQFGTASAKATPIEIDLVQRLPDVIRLGGAYRVTPKFELRADAQYERWSVFNRNCVVRRGEACELGPNGEADSSKVILGIPRAWKDAFGARAGAAFWPVEQLEVFGSMGFGTAAVPKGTMDPAGYDATNIYGTLGGRYKFSPHFALAGSFTHIQYLSVTVNDSFLYQYVPPSRSPSAAGEYNSRVTLMNVNAVYSF